MTDLHKTIGRCFEVIKLNIGTAGTVSTQENVMVHYYIELLSGNNIALEMVDEKGEPTGKIIEKGITKDNFNKRFKTCSQHDCPLVPKTIEEISEKMAANRVKKGEEHLARGEFEKAEDKFDRALKFDDENLQALFGLGKAKLELEKVDEAKAIFKLLSEKNALFEQSNKHTFNDFGIYLRRHEMFDLAINSYEQAISLDPEDPVLYFNLGKAYAKKGMLQKGVEIVREAIKIYIDFPEAGKYLAELLEEEKKLLNQIFTQPEESEQE